MADLPTNYLDDILAQSMNGKRKFRITRPDGTFEEVVIEDISEYSQTGSTFGAGDINRTNQAVNEKFDSEDVVDPMLTTEPGFAADAYKTKLQFDEQNKKMEKNIITRTKTFIQYVEANTDVDVSLEPDTIQGYTLLFGYITGFQCALGSNYITKWIPYNNGNIARPISIKIASSQTQTIYCYVTCVYVKE